MDKMERITVYVPSDIKEQLRKRASKRKRYSMSSFVRTAIKEHIRHTKRQLKRYYDKYYNDEDWRNRRIEAVKRCNRKKKKCLS